MGTTSLAKKAFHTIRDWWMCKENKWIYKKADQEKKTCRENL